MLEQEIPILRCIYVLNTYACLPFSIHILCKTTLSGCSGAERRPPYVSDDGDVFLSQRDKKNVKVNHTLDVLF